MSRFQLTSTLSVRWFVVVAAFLGVHLFPFFYFKQALVLGFDTGLYRRYVLEPLTSIPHMAVPGLDHTVIVPRVWLDLFRLSGLSTDIVLYGSYVAACALLLSGFFVWVRSRSTTGVALLAVLLVLFAPVYYVGYWFFLYKNVLALGMLFWLLYSLEQKHFAAALFLTILLPITHQSTTVFVGVLFATLALVSWFRTDRLIAKRYALLWGVLCVVYLIYHPAVGAKISAPPTAAFLTLREFTIMTSPLLVLVLVRARQVVGWLKTEPVLACALGLLAVWMVGGLPYADRMGFFAIFFLAAVSARALASSSRMKLWVGLFLSLYGIYGVYGMTEQHPYFDQTMEQQLQTLSTLPSTASVVTPGYVAAWVEGYTIAAVYAPGLFKDAATPVEWEYYWSHQSSAYDRAFLASFPAPLYFFVPIREQAGFLPDAHCLEQLSTFLFRYTCGAK